MGYQFSEYTLNILLANGWTYERTVDVTAYKEYYANTQQPVSDMILEFLQSFGELEVTAPSKLYSGVIKTLFSIQPLKTAGLETLNEYSKDWIKKPLCEVGTADNIDIFVMTPDGESYVMFDEWVFMIGSSVTEAIENLCHQNGGIRIPEPTS